MISLLPLSKTCSVVSFETGVSVSPIKFTQRKKIISLVYTGAGVWVDVVIKALRYYSDGPGIDSR
jgi:hypothetical protein